MLLPAAERARLSVELGNGRGMIFVRADSEDERDVVESWLRDGRRATTVRYSTDRDPISAMVAAGRDGCDVVIARGAESVSDRDSWLRAMNVGREALREIAVPVVILASNAVLDALAQQAPDLWSWRASVYEGEELMGGAPPVAAPTVAAPTVALRPGPAAGLLQHAYEQLADTSYRHEFHVEIPGRGASRLVARLRLGASNQVIALVGTRGVGVTETLHDVRFSLPNMLVIGDLELDTAGRAEFDTPADWYLTLALALERIRADLGLPEREVSRDLRNILQHLMRPQNSMSGLASALALAPSWAPRVDTTSVAKALAAGLDSSLASLRDRRLSADEIPRERLQILGGGLLNLLVKQLSELHNEWNDGVLVSIDLGQCRADEIRAALDAVASLTRRKAGMSALLGIGAGVVDDSYVAGRAVVEELPAVDTTTDEGRRLLGHALHLRGLTPNLIDGAALDRLLTSCGGVFRTLFALSRDSVLEAVLAGRSTVTLSDADLAVRRYARSLSQILYRDWVSALARLHRGGNLTPEERAQLEPAGLVIRGPEGPIVAPALVQSGLIDRILTD
jgi:hypothetical protein